MPKKDTLNLIGMSVPAVNVTFRVGAGGDNGPADVMLIQALFRYIGYSDSASRGQLGTPMAGLPAITTVCDGTTQRAIWAFQQKNRRKLLTVDGIVHPASYEGRVLKNMANPVMSITLLHNIAFDTALMRGDSDYIDGLTKLEPRLRAWLM